MLFALIWFLCGVVSVGLVTLYDYYIDGYAEITVDDVGPMLALILFGMISLVGIIIFAYITYVKKKCNGIIFKIGKK